MAAVAVGADNARYDAMDATTNISGIGGGSGAGVETDIAYQNAAAISRKATGGGFYSDTGTPRNMTTTGRNTWLVKYWLTNYSSLTTGANKGVVRLGSGTTAYHEYVFGNSTIIYPPKGGFVIDAINPSIASHRNSTTGSPSLTAMDYWAAYADCSASKEANVVMDAIDVGTGLYLTAGDGASADGDFADFVADDEGDATNGRYGYVVTQGGIPFVLGKLYVGCTVASGVRTSAVTEFTATGTTVVWSENRAKAAFSGLVADLRTASTAVLLTRCAFSSRGTSAGEDTRAVLDVFGTTGTFDMIGGSIRNFVSLLLTSAATLTDVVLTLVKTITLAGGTMNGCTINGHPTAVNVPMITASTLANITGCVFDNTGGTGHAIEIDTAGTYSFDGNLFTGYGADASTSAVIRNTSGGLVTINVTNGGSTPTYLNVGGGSSTVVNNAVTFTVNNLDTATLVVIVRVSDDVELYSATESAGSIAYAYNYVSDTLVYINLLDLTTENQLIEGITLGNAPQTLVAQQSADSFYLNP